MPKDGLLRCLVNDFDSTNVLDNKIAMSKK